MSIDFLTGYINAGVLGICLCAGYILKNCVPSEKINRFIPLIMGALGVVLAAWIAGTISPDVILAGLVSGLASTGMYEAVRNLIDGRTDK